MSETILIDSTENKAQIYEQLLPQLKCLVEAETDMVANLANVAAVLHDVFGWWWVGFYLVKGDELVLGPFQGPLACTRIKFGKGVCGAAWKTKNSLFVPDVHVFPGHIACSSKSVAEIVVPIFNLSKEVCAVIDVDSERYDQLDGIDVMYLEQLSDLITHTIFNS